MMMQQAYVQVVLVALGLCKLHIILIRMVKAAQLRSGGFFVCKKLRIGFDILKLINRNIVCSIGGILYENRCYQRHS